MLGAPVLTHISLVRATMVAHMQDPYFRFHSCMVNRCRPFRSLPTVTHLGFLLLL